MEAKATKSGVIMTADREEVTGLPSSSGSSLLRSLVG